MFAEVESKGEEGGNNGLNVDIKETTLTIKIQPLFF